MGKTVCSTVVHVYKSEDLLRRPCERIDKTFENADCDCELMPVDDHSEGGSGRS